ncbi:MAG: hypothetical protein ABW166_19750 [Sedimenticola sp.]
MIDITGKMVTLQERLRFIMKRNELTYRQIGRITKATEQAVYKWLKTGNMSERCVRAVSEHTTIDWLWLGHGITRIEPELLHALVRQKNSNYILLDVNNFSFIAIGEKAATICKTTPESVSGKPFPGYLSDISSADLMVMMQGANILNGLADLSVKIRIVVSVKVVVVTRITFHYVITSQDGSSLVLCSIIESQPDGTENLPASAMIRVKHNTHDKRTMVSNLIKQNMTSEYLQAPLYN